jgi:hypothetical protein
MKINRNTGWALFLIACGGLILLGKLGFGLGSLMGILFPLAMIGLGYIGIRNGSKFFGWAVLVIGLLALLGKFSGLFAILIAAGLIGYGVTLLKRSPNTN